MDTHAFELYRLDRDLNRTDLIAALADMPTHFADLVAKHHADILRRPVDDAVAWSPIEICRHVRDAVQVYGMRFKWMILEDDPFLPNYDEDGWVAESPDGVGQLPDLLSEMQAYRGETVRLLRSIAPEGWSRTGRHELVGAVDLESYVRHQLAHEEQHLEQLARAISA